MTRFRVIPYKPGSRSARDLAQGLNGLRLRLNGSRFRPRGNDVIINWGSSNPNIYHCLNRPYWVSFVANKLSFFNHLTQNDCADTIPQWWSSRDDIPDDAFPVVCRTILNGHSGQGIVIANNRQELVPAFLYVKYVKKQSEFRVHLGRLGGVPRFMSVQQKRRNRDVADDRVNWQVRNHHNGFIYARENVECPDVVVETAIKAFHSTGLDFGAVDVIYNQRENRAYVLEINTAPGLEGQTLTDYVNFFNQYRRT